MKRPNLYIRRRPCSSPNYRKTVITSDNLPAYKHHISCQSSGFVLILLCSTMSTASSYLKPCIQRDYFSTDLSCERSLERSSNSYLETSLNISEKSVS